MPMYNYTIEDYKKAIQEKYKIEKATDNIPHPSQANLRNLCWEIFEKNENLDDLTIFKSFFGFDFDLTKKNHFREQTDRFRPIGTFFKEKTDLTDRDAVNLSAILVDFQPRPFKKFREKGVVGYETSPGNTKIPEPFAVIDHKDSKYESSEGQKNANYEQVSILPFASKPSINLFVNFKEKVLYNFRERLKNTIIATIVIFGLISAVIYFAFFKNHCMQWSNDHYEIVDCDLKIEGIGIPARIELLDKSLVTLHKVNVCDTTTCFDKNGDAIIWYAKTANGVDFFNGHGRHPENNSALRPVTRYILNKYVKK